MEYALAIQLIAGGLQAITVITNYIIKVRQAAQQSGRLTPEQSAELDKLIADAQTKWAQ